MVPLTLPSTYRQPDPASRLAHSLLIVATLVAAMALRVVNLHLWPPGVSADEAIYLTHAARIFRVWNPLLDSPSDRPEMLHQIIAAPLMVTMGPGIFAMRLVSVFLGVIAVAAAYRAARHMAAGSHARWAGLLAAGSLAVMIGHVTLSRAIYPGIVLIPAALLYFDAFMAAMRWGRLRDFALAGGWLAAILMSYTPGLIVFPVTLLALLHRGIGALARRKNKTDTGDTVRAWAIRLGVMALVFAVIASPQFYLLGVHGRSLYFRASDTALELDSAPSQQVATLGRSLLVTVSAFYSHSDNNPQYNAAAAPLLPPILFAVFVIGLGVCLVRLRSLPHWTALLLVALFMLPVVLSDDAPNGQRICGEFAAIPLVVGASWGVWGALSRRGSGWLRLAPQALAVLIVAATGVSTYAIYSTYFQSDPMLRQGKEHMFGRFFETKRQAEVDFVTQAQSVVYLPISEAAGFVTQAYSIASYNQVVTYAQAFGPQEPITLPAGRFVSYRGHPSSRAYAAFMPNGTIVLLPEFDAETQARLAAAAANAPMEVYDRFGDLAATAFDFPPDGTPITIPRAIQHPAQVNLGNQIELVGWSGPETIPPGGGLVEFTLYFTRGPAVSTSPHLLVQVWNTQGRRASALTESSLFDGFFTPRAWQAGDVVPVPVYLRVWAKRRPGVYSLMVGALDGRGERIPVIGANGEPAGDMGTAARLKEPHPEPVSTAGIMPAPAEFGGQIELLGYRLTGPDGGPVDRLGPGQPARLDLYWKANRRPDADYVIFVHALDASGGLVAQDDRQPEDGAYPTGIWDAGEIVMSSHPLSLPEGSAGPFEIYVGLYGWPGLERLPAEKDGQPLADNRAPLDMAPR